MKILFLIDDPPCAAISEWEEIKSYAEKGYYVPTQEAYQLIKSLEQNEVFEKEIAKSRKSIGIPESGLDWKEYRDKYHIRNLKKLSGKERRLHIDLLMKTAREMMRIQGVLNLSYHITHQLKYFIYGNFVYFGHPQITYGYSPMTEERFEEDYLYNVSIHIHNGITKHELIKYIENNWQNIGNLVQNLTPKPNYFISKRDQRIVVLRDKNKLSFKKITDKIIEEFKIDNLEGKINEDAVKTAYGRAKKNIASLADIS